MLQWVLENRDDERRFAPGGSGEAVSKLGRMSL
jgi:hypothetical protein